MFKKPSDKNKKDAENNLNKKTDFLVLKGRFQEFRKTKVYHIGTLVLAFFIGVVIAQPSSSETAEVEGLKSENLSYEDKLDDYETQLSNANNEIETLQEKVDSAKPWFEMKKSEQEKIEQENKEREEAEAKAQKEKEEAEAKKKEEEEKKGYDTGITYSQLARNPDDYTYKKVKFEGKVIQVMEDGDDTQIRLAVNGDYDNIIYGVYKSDIVESRVLEDDYITIMGLSAGLITYKSTMGGNITIPSVAIAKIQQ